MSQIGIRRVASFERAFRCAFESWIGGKTCNGGGLKLLEAGPDGWAGGPNEPAPVRF
jgi:hypothetical protein